MYTPSSSHLPYATCDLVTSGTAVPRLYPTSHCIVSAPVLSLVKVFMTFGYPRRVGSRTFPLWCRSPISGRFPFLVSSHISVILRPLFLYYILHHRSSLLSVTFPFLLLTVWILSRTFLVLIVSSRFISCTFGIPDAQTRSCGACQGCTSLQHTRNRSNSSSDN